MLLQAHPESPAGRSHLGSEISSATASSLLEEATAYVFCRRNSLVDSHDGHDSIQALFRHGDVEKCVLAGEASGHLFSGNGDRSIHIRHMEQKR